MQRQRDRTLLSQQREGVPDFRLSGKIQTQIGDGTMGADVRAAKQLYQRIVAGLADGKDLLLILAKCCMQKASIGVQSSVTQCQPEGLPVHIRCFKGVVDIERRAELHSGLLRVNMYSHYTAKSPP